VQGGPQILGVHRVHALTHGPDVDAESLFEKPNVGLEAVPDDAEEAVDWIWMPEPAQVRKWLNIGVWREYYLEQLLFDVVLADKLGLAKSELVWVTHHVLGVDHVGVLAHSEVASADPFDPILAPRAWWDLGNVLCVQDGDAGLGDITVVLLPGLKVDADEYGIPLARKGRPLVLPDRSRWLLVGISLVV
jgi:hypothetical protein